jgi:hypothetical protein
VAVSDSNLRDRSDMGVSAEQLHAYLRSKRWNEDGKIRSVATIWHRALEEDAEVLVPLPSAKDYRPRLREALSVLAAFEKREVSEVLSDVRRLFVDVIAVRVIHADTSDGTIPINDGVLLIAKAKELLSAAAQSLYTKRKQFVGKTRPETKAYLDSLLLGQTEIGSYVVNVIAPVQQNASSDQTVEEKSLAEAVTQNLVAGLEALEKASDTFEAQGGASLHMFDEAVMSGASSNLCEALLGFSGEKHNRTFEITVTSAPKQLFATDPRTFEFDAKHVEILEKATSYYKDEYVLQEHRLTGFIRKLSRQIEADSGTVMLQAEVNGIERQVKIELSGDDYHLAVLAHDQREMVRVFGEVHVKSKSAWMLNPSKFGVITQDDLL